MNIAILLLAGSSTRIKNISVPKQLYLINDKPLFIYSASTLNNSPFIDEIILVTSKECLSSVNNYVKEYNLNKVKGVILGGESRQESVRLSLEYLKERNIDENDILLIHDSARVLLSEDIIKNNILLCKKYHAVTTAINIEDTIIDDESNYYDRNKIYRLQTPQTFEFNLIYQAHKIAKENGVIVNDDSQLMDLVNQEVCYAQGNKLNFKVTTDEDLIIISKLTKD